MCEDCLYVAALATKFPHLGRVVVIVCEWTIDRCDWELRLIGGIRGRLSDIKHEFHDIEHSCDYEQRRLHK